MRGFHSRNMVSNRACRLWANMVRDLDVEMIVPQHGRPFVGSTMINRFLDCFELLLCGIDLMSQENYTIPDKSVVMFNPVAKKRATIA